MEQCTKSLNSNTQIELLCSIFANHPLHFQKAQLAQFFINLNIFCTIGYIKKITTKVCLNVKSNGATYKEFKFKNTN
jgi:hypothetical protein